MTGQIRLACNECDRQDFDGIDQIPENWQYVDKVQSYGEATSSVPIDDSSRSVFAWWTHLGYCPECIKEMNERMQ